MPDPSCQSVRARRWLQVSLVAATVLVGASFLPWARSGDATRSSYGLVQAAVRLELLEPWQQRVATAWYLATIAVGAAWLLGRADRLRAAAILCAIVSALGLVLALATLRSPLRSEPALTLSAVAGVVSLCSAGGALLAAAQRRSTREAADDGRGRPSG